jgi:hypothetical protein
MVAKSATRLEGINISSDFQRIDVLVSLLYASCLLDSFLYCRNDVRLMTPITMLHRQRSWWHAVECGYPEFVDDIVYEYCFAQRTCLCKR